MSPDLSSSEPVRIIVACGTAIATATYVAEKVRKLLEKNKIKGEIYQAKAQEVNYWIKMLGKVHLILATTHVAPEDKSIPVLNAMPFLTGIGEAELEKKIVNILTSRK
ncbi:MAG: PTS sugar transporter subunit IIB [Desulfurococcaceae archaeon]